MTSKHTHEEPNSNKQVLNHYFDELLPSGEQGCESGEQESKEVSAESNIQDSHQLDDASLQTPPPTESTHENKAERSEESDLNDHPKQQISECLLALDDEAPLTKTDSAGYEAHKQRLEKMLKQLSPVNPVALTEEPIVETAPDVEVPVSIESDINTASVDEESVNIDKTVTNTTPLSSRWLANGRPHWAQNPFDVLLIDVNGLKLAVPLIALGHIQRLEGDMTMLFGQSKWFMGLQKTPYGNIKTIDTAEYVMPERSLKEGNKEYQFVISISGMSWGLAVDNIDQPTLIDPEAIRWRANRENRPWMAGTVKDHMCVLLDIPVMGEILQKEDLNHSNNTGE